MGLGLLASIGVGGLAGWIASVLMRARTGLFANIVLGIVGAVVLNWILAQIGIYARDAWLPQLVVGVAGAALLISVFRAIRR
jgi:uncharacterized membrane protein YeaQ/YmgE (transglycosylase-associated protein family)